MGEDWKGEEEEEDKAFCWVGVVWGKECFFSGAGLVVREEVKFSSAFSVCCLVVWFGA